jgi:hypothetical protein
MATVRDLVMAEKTRARVIFGRRSVRLSQQEPVNGPIR